MRGPFSSPVPFICFLFWCSWFVALLVTLLIRILIEGKLPPKDVLSWIVRSLVIVGLGLTLIAVGSEIGLG